MYLRKMCQYCELQFLRGLLLVIIYIFEGFIDRTSCSVVSVIDNAQGRRQVMGEAIKFIFERRRSYRRPCSFTKLVNLQAAIPRKPHPVLDPVCV